MRLWGSGVGIGGWGVGGCEDAVGGEMKWGKRVNYLFGGLGGLLGGCNSFIIRLKR